MTEFDRLNVNNLLNAMVNARSVVSGWDILCSYELQSLNEVLLEEYKKHPVNSKLKFNSTKKIIGNLYEISCDLKLGNPTLSFSTAESGIYDLEIPLADGSYCNETFRGATLKTAIHPGFNILTSGPLQTVQGTGKDNKRNPSNQIVELGDRNNASVILHFGRDLRSVRIIPHQNIPEDLKEVFEEIVSNFATNIDEVDYDLAQVVKNDNTEGLILTPKSFIFTTMADKRNRNNGALNIWVQTNESGRPKGNPQPSFYPKSPVLPIPLEHTSTIIFSHELINKRYLKPTLEQYYDVTFVDKIVNGTGHPDTMSLVPRDELKKKFYVSFEGIDFKQLEYEVDYNKHPFQVYTFDNKLHWMWEYETSIKYVETKVVEDFSLGIGIGVVIGGVVGFVIGGPPGALVGAGIGSQAGGGAAALASGTIDKITQFLKLSVSIHKPITFTSINNTKFSAKIDLSKDDLKIDLTLANSSGFSIFKREQHVIDWDIVKSRFIPKLKDSIFIPEIDLGTLDYFAEANILFNEGRFKISSDKAVHFPYDTVVIGDINIPQKNNIRRKRQNNIEPTTSSGNKIESPIHTVLNWLCGSIVHVKMFNPLETINQIFTKSDNSGTTNKNFTQTYVNNYDINSGLILGDFFIRNFFKIKPHNTTEEAVNFSHTKANALNLITEFENVLNDFKNLFGVDLDFDPITLMNVIEKRIINGNQKEIAKILYECVAKYNPFIKEDVAEEIQNRIIAVVNIQNNFFQTKNRPKTENFVVTNDPSVHFTEAAIKLIAN